MDLNHGPSGYEPDELPDCSTPRYVCDFKSAFSRQLPSDLHQALAFNRLALNRLISIAGCLSIVTVSFKLTLKSSIVHR